MQHDLVLESMYIMLSAEYYDKIYIRDSQSAQRDIYDDPGKESSTIFHPWSRGLEASLRLGSVEGAVALNCR